MAHFNSKKFTTDVQVYRKAGVVGNRREKIEDFEKPRSPAQTPKFSRSPPIPTTRLLLQYLKATYKKAIIPLNHPSQIKMPDLHYENQKLAQIYDLDNGWAEDRDFYLALAGTPPKNILDIGCG